MIVDEDDDEALLPLAGRIAEGSVVDRDTEQHHAPDADRAVWNALLDIAAIEAAHRSAERAFDRLQPGAPAAPRHWGHLTILEKIGEGAFGEIYRAHDNKLQIDVALKLSAVDRRMLNVSTVLDEARLLARVRHPNVVRVYGADQKQGQVGLWMDLVQGRTLEELTRTQGFGASEAINVGIELCRALAAVHSVGVLHGDIKAHNVMRRDGGQLVLVDFGAGRPLAAEPRAGHDVIGTPVYLAPEVLNDHPRSTASDIYSLGVLLFHLVTNDYPVYASDRAAFVQAHAAGARKRLRDLRPDLADGFIKVVERATADDPRARFTSAGAFEAALVNLMAPADSPREAPRPRWPRRTIGLGIGAVATLALGALLLSSALRPGGTDRGSGPPEPTPRRDIVLPRDAYDIEAAFYRGAAGNEQRLIAGGRVRLNDEIHLSVEASKATYLYVVNEDDKGNAFLLFPHSDVNLANPVPANRQVRLPDEHNWEVDSVGGQEHFIVFASTEPLAPLEEALRKLPSPTLNPGQRNERLPPETLERLRGVGGLKPARPRDQVRTHFRDLFTVPLSGRETVSGLWARQLTLENNGH